MATFMEFRSYFRYFLAYERKTESEQNILLLKCDTFQAVSSFTYLEIQPLTIVLEIATLQYTTKACQKYQAIKCSILQIWLVLKYQMFSPLCTFSLSLFLFLLAIIPLLVLWGANLMEEKLPLVSILNTAFGLTLFCSKSEYSDLPCCFLWHCRLVCWDFVQTSSWSIQPCWCHCDPLY